MLQYTIRGPIGRSLKAFSNARLTLTVLTLRSHLLVQATPGDLPTTTLYSNYVSPSPLPTWFNGNNTTLSAASSCANPPPPEPRLPQLKTFAFYLHSDHLHFCGAPRPWGPGYRRRTRPGLLASRSFSVASSFVCSLGSAQRRHHGIQHHGANSQLTRYNAPRRLPLLWPAQRRVGQPRANSCSRPQA